MPFGEIIPARAAIHAALAGFLILLVPACDRGPQILVFAGQTMGTTYHVKARAPDWGRFEHKEKAAAAQEAVILAFEDVNGKMSTYIESSELSEINRAAAAEPVQVSADTLAVFQLAREIGEASGGAFDITVGPLVNLWGFGPEKRINQDAPGDAAIAAVLPAVGFDTIEINSGEQMIAKQHGDTYCDLSAIAKGYAVDKAAKALEALGITDYMVELGGEVRTGGVNDAGVPWRIAIERPASLPDQQVHLVVPLSGMAMATSGDYRNFTEIDGQRYSHTIDPKTGRPVAHKLASVSVITEECAEADGYATAIMALGPDAGLDLAERQGLAVYIIVHDDAGGYTTRASTAFSAYQHESE